MSANLRLRVGCVFTFDVPAASFALIQVAARRGEAPRVLEETWQLEPEAGITTFADLYGNLNRRAVLGVGRARLGYDAQVEVPDLADEKAPDARQCPVEELPGEVTHFLLPSRYCLSDSLMGTAWELFGRTSPGWSRAQAISDWVNRHLAFRYGASDRLTTAVDAFQRKEGVCRDFTHLFITFCRALNIPARYVFGYLPDLYVEPPDAPMDFAAWAEVYLGDRWWTFDPRNNRRRVGRVVIGRGRDAADVSMVTTWGPAKFESLEVWADLNPTKTADFAGNPRTWQRT
ncbi:MAG: transglutaminase family protein [Candidatus Dormibacteraeota bacterium]|nr:transglutaminase family protein [Candidatus Dormibacteraeota bacterium]